MNTTSMRHLSVPLRFWDDFLDRTPVDDPETQMPSEVRRTARHAVITGTPTQIASLRSDAAFYCDRYGPDQCPPGLKTSARFCIAAIDQVT